MMRRKFQSSNEEQDEAFFGPPTTPTMPTHQEINQAQHEIIAPSIPSFHVVLHVTK